MNTLEKKSKDDIIKEVITKTEADFEKWRRKTVYLLIASIILALIGAWRVYIVILVETAQLIQNGTEQIITGLSRIICLLITEFLVINAISLLGKCNVLKKIKALKVEIRPKMQERTTIEKRLAARKEKLVSKRNLLSWICDLPKAIPDQKWGYYITNMIKDEEERVGELQETFDLLDEETICLEAQLQFYNQVQEKTFWQYVKSKKWLLNNKKKKHNENNKKTK